MFEKGKGRVEPVSGECLFWKRKEKKEEGSPRSVAVYAEVSVSGGGEGSEAVAVA